MGEEEKWRKKKVNICRPGRYWDQRRLNCREIMNMINKVVKDRTKSIEEDLRGIQGIIDKKKIKWKSRNTK